MCRATLDVPLDQQRVVAEGGEGLAPRRGQSLGQRLGLAHDPHALAAAPGRRLDQQREADLGRRPAASSASSEPVAVDRGHHRDAGFHRDPPGRGPCAPSPRSTSAGGPMNTSPASSQARGERGPLGQEPVSRMDRLRAGPPRGLEQRRNRQVGLGRRRPGRCGRRCRPPGRAGRRASASEYTATVRRPASRGRAQHPDGDLAAVGHQD